ncbi:MAG: hypothetical protein WD534_12985 [Phycisphaeraceae bacterium]
MPDAHANLTGPITLLCDAGDVTIEAAAVSEDAAEATSAALPRFSMVAYSGEPMRVEGWRHPVVVDLEGLRIESQRKPIRFAHSAYQGVGHTERIVADGGRLIAEGVVSRDTPAAREVVSSGKRGFPWQASIGAAVEQAEFIKPGTTVTVNGRTFPGPVFVARKTVLGEISFVDAGADRNTSASIAAQADKDNTMSEKTNDNGQHSDTTDDTATATASGKGAAATPDTDDQRGTEPASTVTASAESAGAVTPPQDTDDHIAAMRTSTATELRRQAKIRQVASDHPDIAAKAIEEGWSSDKAELEVLRASRPKVTGGGAPAMHAIDSHVDGSVLEAACMLTAGLSQPEKVFEEKTLDAAQRRFRGGIGLQELLLEAAWANGYSGRNFRASREVLRYAFNGQLPGVQASSFSTLDIGGILSNVANKFLLEGFFSVERTWRNICSVRNVSDFKTVTSYRLIGTDQYEKVAPGGELKHGTLGEETYANRADTYGLLLSVDRRDIINDDLGAITTVPRKLGRGSGLKINDVFWTEFLDNGTFFAAGNNNYLDGADTKLSIDGLTKAEVAFLDQVDSDGKPIGVMPAMALVPTSLSAIGTTLWKSLEVRDPGSSTKYPIANPHAGKFRVEVSRYLANSIYSGASDKAWYLLAEPNDLSVIEVAFLNGQESPTIETAEADFNVLGVQMRGYHDFGVAKQDPRGGTKSKGEA